MAFPCDVDHEWNLDAPEFVPGILARGGNVEQRQQHPAPEEHFPHHSRQSAPQDYHAVFKRSGVPCGEAGGGSCIHPHSAFQSAPQRSPFPVFYQPTHPAQWSAELQGKNRADMNGHPVSSLHPRMERLSRLPPANNSSASAPCLHDSSCNVGSVASTLQAMFPHATVRTGTPEAFPMHSEWDWQHLQAEDDLRRQAGDQMGMHPGNEAETQQQIDEHLRWHGQPADQFDERAKKSCLAEQGLIRPLSPGCAAAAGASPKSQVLDVRLFKKNDWQLFPGRRRQAQALLTASTSTALAERSAIPETQVPYVQREQKDGWQHFAGAATRRPCRPTTGFCTINSEHRQHVPPC